MNERSFTSRMYMSDKKTQILEATEHLLAQHGFDRLSMQMVANEAGVAAGTIYRYFSDKMTCYANCDCTWFVTVPAILCADSMMTCHCISSLSPCGAMRGI